MVAARHIAYMKFNKGVIYSNVKEALVNPGHISYLSAS